jgi:hypothetical protein
MSAIANGQLHPLFAAAFKFWSCAVTTAHLIPAPKGQSAEC